MAEAQSSVLYAEEFTRLQAVCADLHREASAKLVFLVDKNGQLIAASGDTQNMDTTSIATLAASNIAATDGLAKLLGEREFSILFHEGEKDNLHFSLVAKRMILVVIFDNRTSLGLVRLRVRKFSAILETLFKEFEQSRSQKGESESVFAEITDEDIENLFND